MRSTESDYLPMAWDQIAMVYMMSVISLCCDVNRFLVHSHHVELLWAGNLTKEEAPVSG